ncbi:MAG: hypothetical protein WCS69_09775 [Ignavibacteriaceae bacterium]
MRLSRPLLLFFVLFSIPYLAQQNRKITGTVTYISSQNFYVRFENTKNISVGDTVYASETGTITGRITYLSSQSAACSYVLKLGVELNQQVYVLNEKIDDASGTTDQKVEMNEDFFTTGSGASLKKINARDNFDLSGRVSVRSFTNYTSSISHAQNQYWRYSLSLRGKNIGTGKLDFQSSATYGYRAETWKNSNNIWNNLKVYDFFFSYQPAVSLKFQVGRIRNQNLYSLSTFDGLLFEYAFHNFTAGTFVGSHPDWQNMGVNINLLQYGAFLSREDSLGGAAISNNLSITNQTNNGKTDRRFFYFLHRTRLKDFAFSLSSEFDLYQVELNTAKSVLTPTSIYASALYRFNKKLSFDFSYDARKTIYYFESFKSVLDSILDSRMRQGVRLGAYYQWSRTLSIGVNGGFAKQDGDIHPSFNAGTSVSVTEISKLNLSFNADVTYLQSNFLDGFAYGIKFNKNFLSDYLNVGFGLRRVDYLFARNTSDGIAQNIVNVDLRWQLQRLLYFNLVYEFVSEKRVTANRIFFGLSQAF